MKLKSLAKYSLVTAALALTMAAAPVSGIKAEAAEGTYTVEKDDYLKKIAKKVYGDEDLWRVIYDANSNVVKSNYIIYKGQVLTIPAVNDNSAPAVTTPAPEAATPAPTTPDSTSAPAPTTPDSTSAPAPTTPDSTSAPASTTPAPTTPDPTPAPAPTTPVPSQEEGYLLDYNQIASWVTGGFVGINTADEAVIMGTDATDDYGIIIFTDDSTMTAASFVGPITYDGAYMTITDEANGLALTFTVAEIGDGTLALDMGNLGAATVQAQTRESVLEFIRLAIDGYTHVA